MQNIKKNYLYSVSYQILAIIIPLITVPYLTRILGTTMLGIYAYTNSVAYYFFLVAMLGMSNYGNRTIASCRDDIYKLNRTFNELIKMQLSFGTLVLLTYVFYLMFLYLYNADYFIPSLIWGLYIFSGVIDISWFYWGLEKFSITVIKNVVIKIITTVGIFLFVKKEEDLLVYIILIAGSSLVCSAALWTQVKGNAEFVHVTYKEAYSHFKENITLFIPVIAVSIYTVMDKVMLGNICPIKELGYYDNVQKIMTLPTGIITALGAVMLPRISNLIAKGNNSDARSLTILSMQFSNFFSIALSFGLAAIAPCFTVVYFGNEFENTSFMMELFCITIIFIAWANVIRTQFLIPAKKDKVYISSVLLGAIVNVIVNLLLIPKLDAIGAVVGTICAESTVAIVQTLAVRKQLPIRQYFRDGIVFVVPGVIMFMIVRLITKYTSVSVLSLVLQIAVGALTYLFIGMILITKLKLRLGDEIVRMIKKFCR